MLKSLLTAGALAVAATGATAATYGFELTMSGSANIPTFTLENTGTSAAITQFSFSVGDTTRNWDAIYTFSPPPGGTMTLLQGDTNDSGGVRVDVGIIGFTGFDAGETASWNADVDPDNSNTSIDYRVVLFNNDAADNAQLIATFDNGQTLSLIMPDAPNAGSYTFAASAAPVPLPAGLPLLVGGLAVFGVMRRRAGQ